MRPTRIQKKVRLSRHPDEALPLDPRDPDILRAKRLLPEFQRPDPIRRVS
jgi:hypothetical protein